MSGPALDIALLLKKADLVDACRSWLPSSRYTTVDLGLTAGRRDLLEVLEEQREAVDALVIQQSLLGPDLKQSLLERGLLFPAVVVGEVIGRVDYHPEEVHLAVDQLEQLSYNVDAAISRFLRHGQKEESQRDGQALDVEGGKAVQGSPWRMSSRLQERLGYLGVFYKRDPSRFLSNLPLDEQQELLKSLQRTYRDLLLSYFRDPAAANQALESFVNTAFFGDLPITRAVEIHMNLIDDFWKKLRLEGHKNDFLQDYRLALLDVMSHLCEMYRRSIPTEAQLAAPSATAALTDLEVSS